MSPKVRLGEISIYFRCCNLNNTNNNIKNKSKFHLTTFLDKFQFKKHVECCKDILFIHWKLKCQKKCSKIAIYLFFVVCSSSAKNSQPTTPQTDAKYDNHLQTLQQKLSSISITSHVPVSKTLAVFYLENCSISFVCCNYNFCNTSIHF